MSQFNPYRRLYRLVIVFNDGRVECGQWENRRKPLDEYVRAYRNVDSFVFVESWSDIFWSSVNCASALMHTLSCPNGLPDIHDEYKGESNEF